MASFKMRYHQKQKEWVCEVNGRSVNELTDGVYRLVTDTHAGEIPRVRLEAYVLDRTDIDFGDADVTVVPVELRIQVPDPTDEMLWAGGNLLDQMVDLGGLVPSELANLLWNEMASKWPRGVDDVSHRDSV